MIHDEKTVARFMSLVEQPAHGGACWLWKTRRGYPQFSVNNTMVSAAKTAWEIFHRTRWPIGMQACHSCDAGPRGCVNPEHIRPDTQSGNIKEAFYKRRATQGFKPRTHCKRGHELTAENVIAPRNERWRECKTCATERKRAWEKANPKPRRTF